MLHNVALLLALVVAPATTTTPSSAGASVARTADSLRGSIVQGAAAARPQAVDRRERPKSLIDLLPDGDPKSALAPRMGSLGASAGGMNVSKGTLSQGGHQLPYFTVTLPTSSGFAEDFIIYTPTPMPVAPRPLVVAFHGFGVSQKDIPYNTSLIQECAARGWFLLAPLSASGSHFMSEPGQINTQVGLDWALAALNVDPTRIYGVGFSMGGGMALNYAARHVDPKRGMFAAVVDHTGAVDVNDVYTSDPAAQYVFDYWYGNGAPGSANVTAMARASVIQYNPIYQQVNPFTDLARNLMHLPLRIVRAANEPLAYLATQSDRLHQHMQSLGRAPGPNYSYEVVAGDDHTWDTLNVKQALDWLSQFTLQMPQSGRTLAVTESTYFHFFVDQTVPGEFTPFDWDIDPIANELRVSQTANLTTLAVDLASTGLSTTQQLSVVLSTADGLADKIALKGVNVAPASVKRDGVAVSGASWSYNATGKILTLTETDGAGVHVWTIQP